MALEASNIFETGKIAPDFKLWDVVSEKTLSLEELKGAKGTVIFFICNHCPFVIHVNDALVELANDYQNKGIGFIAISSNDVEKYPADSPELMKKTAKELQYPFPYLYDQTQEVAKVYDAACTPDFYIFDENLKAVYHGQLDGSRPENGIPVTGEDIRLSLETLLKSEPALKNQKPSIGCSIKWK